MIARLKRRSEFLRVAGAQQKWVTPGLILQARARAAQRRTDDDAEVRVGFTVSRKVGNAVERNRAKRRLRAVVDALLPVLARPDYDYVVIGRRNTLTRPFEALEQDLEKALKQLGVRREAPTVKNRTSA